MLPRAIFAFDFSMNKPAMASLVNGKLSFHIFPISLDQISMEKLESCGIIVKNRQIGKVNDGHMTENELIIEHVKRASELADMIVSEMIDILDFAGISINEALVANEGRSFGSIGNAALDLSGYKYVLMLKLSEAGFSKFRTYPPMTIKHTAGCAKKGKTKDSMIEAMASDGTLQHEIIKTLASDSSKLKKKTNYVTCMDDIADSYWCMITTLKKEEMI